MTTKFCINCKFHTDGKCWQPLAYVKPKLDLVTGRMSKASWAKCLDMRDGPCGYDAEFFVPRSHSFDERECLQLEELYRLVS